MKCEREETSPTGIAVSMDAAAANPTASAGGGWPGTPLPQARIGKGTYSAAKIAHPVLVALNSFVLTFA